VRTGPGRSGRLWRRVKTVGRLLRHFAARGKWFLLPLVIVLVLSGALLAVTTGLSYVAPFVYSIF
jgi:hypothetical protein